MNHKILSAGAVVALAIFLVGCGPKNAHFTDVRDAVFDGSESLNTNVELSLGILPLWMAETVTGFIDEPEVQEASTYLDHVKRVEIGVYEVHDSFKKQHREAAQRVKAKMKAHGFEPMVLVRENKETVGVYVSTKEDEFPEELFVVVMADHEVVLVKVKGKLDKIIQEAAKNHAHELPNFDKVFKEEIVL